MEIIVYTVVGQLAVVGMLFKWLHTQSRDNKIAIEKLTSITYTKSETHELIDLKLKPIEVGIDHVQRLNRTKTYDR